MVGPSPFPLTPCRRTMVTFRAPEGFAVQGWPLVADLSHHLYFAPESAGLMASPMDQDPMPPCDVRPDEMGVALAMERLQTLAPRLAPRSIVHKWAGLRTFAPDQVMVIGEDPVVRGFFWLAGQGGAGIETSPAVGRIAADLITEGRTDLGGCGGLFAPEVCWGRRAPLREMITPAPQGFRGSGFTVSGLSIKP